jgi:hypothetical protein
MKSFMDVELILIIPHLVEEIPDFIAGCIIKEG